MMPLLASSQTLSIDTTCCVPCNTLKKALLVKTERDYLKDQLEVSRDSSKILLNVVAHQDSVIKTQDSSILLYKENEKSYQQIVSNKDQIIEIKDTQIKKAKNKTKLAWATTGLSTLAFILILL
jgi:hypothetical protein